MKRFILFLVICISSFMIYTNNVKALTTTGVLSNTTASNYININDQVLTSSYYGDNRPYFTGYGEGNVIFSILTSNQTAVVDQIAEVIVFNNNDIFTCDIGNNTSYYDSGTERVLYTVNCPVNFPSGRGLNGIRIVRGDKYGILKVNFSQYITFISKDSAVDVSSIVNAINNAASDLMNYSNGFYNNWNALFPKIDNIYASIGSIDENTEDILSAITDIKNSSISIANNTEQIKNDIKSENVSGAESSADDLKNNSAFQDNTGLSGIISMPLTFVNSLTNTCEPISLTIPYMDVNVSIPCLQPIITNKMPLLANLIKIIVNGFIVYRILLDIFQIVRNAKNPEDDRIEVLDL